MGRRNDKGAGVFFFFSLKFLFSSAVGKEVEEEIQIEEGRLLPLFLFGK